MRGGRRVGRRSAIIDAMRGAMKGGRRDPIRVMKTQVYSTGF
jgi:hypothetical protein